MSLGPTPADVLGAVSAMVFDTGGTIFDWHTAVHRSFARVGTARGIDADWPALTKTWRELSTTMVDAGMPMSDGRATLDMDGVLAVTLRTTLERHGVRGFTEGDESDLVLAWWAMDPWPDVPAALQQLRRRFVVAPFTILRTALVVEASRRAGLSWDAVISCEMIGVYKTRRHAYDTAARWLDLPAERILLVSTHNNDIRAARSFGFRTAYVYRPREWWDAPSRDPEPDPAAEIVVDDLLDLVARAGLGAGRP
jgi:2-haloacid dehalogenase